MLSRSINRAPKINAERKNESPFSLASRRENSKTAAPAAPVFADYPRAAHNLRQG
jgi:hypothetical protein